MPQDLFETRYNVHVPQATLDLINKTFPESEPINPEFIAPDKDTNLYLTEAAEISITFIHEGAGHKNSFGYFTYELDSEGEVTNMSELKYIFNNASMVGAGGDLQVGDTVDLGLFQQGTRIGWFLGANEFNGNDLKFYSIDSMNPDNGLKHTCAVFDLNSRTTFYGFEDLWGGGDEDYNDLLWYVKATPWTAIDRSQMATTDVLEGLRGRFKSRCRCL